MGGGVAHFAQGDLALQVDHLVVGEEAEGVELELGRVPLLRGEADVGVICDAPGGRGHTRRLTESTGESLGLRHQAWAQTSAFKMGVFPPPLSLFYEKMFIGAAQ